MDSLSSRVRNALESGGGDDSRIGSRGALGGSGEAGMPGRLVRWPVKEAVHAVAQSIARLPAFSTSRDVKQVCIKLPNDDSLPA